MTYSGNIWLFGDDVDTDVIISGKYLRDDDNSVWAEHVFEVLDPDFSKKINKGDIILAGSNFGCGSSREQAAIAIKGAGIAAVVAKSFGRIFFRNAINIGLPVFTGRDIELESLETGDEAMVDAVNGRLHIKGRDYQLEKIPPFMADIISAGGLLNYYMQNESRKKG
ncbi:MAG: 3-isopropylmalate dehydratase small subunit [Spirochaetales bacterium]|nr:3-isopropylmalate dehydratase small subunit [Spirochaetales bacterium]